MTASTVGRGWAMVASILAKTTTTSGHRCTAAEHRCHLCRLLERSN